MILPVTFNLEERKSYVFAKDRIPGFKENQNTEEYYVYSPIPNEWKIIPLNNTWKVKMYEKGEKFIDWPKIDKDYDSQKTLKIEEITKETVKNWENIEIPCSLAMRMKNGYMKDFRGIAYYYKQHKMPQFNKQKQAVFIKFYGAGYRTDLWINKKYVGFHHGVFNPFKFNITKFISPGKNIEIIVKTIHTQYHMVWGSERPNVGIFKPVRIEIRDDPHVSDVKIRANMSTSSIDVKFNMYNKKKIKSALMKAVVEEVKTGKQAGVKEQKINLLKENTIRIKLDDPHYWSPDDPFLYYLKIIINGRVARITRFGYRVMEIKDGPTGTKDFFLNGKRIFLRGFMCIFTRSFLVQRHTQNTGYRNHKGRMREVMLALKFANINAIREHSFYNNHDETFYNLCDELGFILYYEFHGMEYFFKPKYNNWMDCKVDSLRHHYDAFIESITYFHNHPSVCMFNAGNEIYEFALGKDYKANGILEKYYNAIKEHDFQMRPVSGSSGRQVWDHKTKVDFADHHNYIGYYYGSYGKIHGYIDKTVKQINNAYGDAIPFTIMECGDTHDYRVHNDVHEKMKPLLSQKVLDRKKFAALVKQKSATWNWYRSQLNSGGLRPFIMDLPLFREMKAYLIDKHMLETYRIRYDTIDGVALNVTPSAIACHSEEHPRPGLNLQPWPETGELVIANPLYAIRSAYYPLQAYLDIENYHIICGDKSKAPVHLINGTMSDTVCDLTILIRNGSNKSKELFSKKDIRVKAGESIKIPFSIKIGENFKSAKYTVETYVHKGNKKLAENYYYIHTLSPKDRIMRFPKRKTALYDIAAVKFKGMTKTTSEILDYLKIPYTLITDFSKLSDYEVLIVGANSLDAKVSESRSRINKWVTKGGRILVFEQNSGVSIPWSDKDRIVIQGKAFFMELYCKDHPIFKGIADEMQWESPMGYNRELHQTSLELNEAFLAIAAVEFYDKENSVGALISDRKIGKGESLLSMLSTVDRFNRDATITRYVENLLKYVLSDKISVFAAGAESTSVTSEKILNLADKDAIYIDMKKAVNKGFSDDAPEDKKGGWTDYGSSADMRSLPVGKTKLNGNVPFNIIDPKENNGKSCIVLKGPTRDYFPEKSDVIPINKKFEKLYFLHTQMYVNAEEGDSIVEYDIFYKDNKKVTVKMKNKIDVADWWRPQSLPNGNLVFRNGEICGLWVTEWVNTNPKLKITGIQIRSTGKGIPILVAITGKEYKDYKVNVVE
ncbi:glycoside hydrolase family 2 TIM barrel-domain containing protein [Spirochaetota bacterium]